MKRKLLLCCLTCVLFCSACKPDPATPINAPLEERQERQGRVTVTTVSEVNVSEVDKEATEVVTSEEEIETILVDGLGGQTSSDAGYITADTPVASFTITKNGYRDYYTKLDDEITFIEPNTEDAKLLSLCTKALTGNTEFDAFCAWNSSTDDTSDDLPFALDGYLTELGTPKAQLNWVLDVDTDYDGVVEQFAVVSIAPRMWVSVSENEFLLYIKGDDIQVLQQTCDIILSEVYDFTGQRRCVEIQSGSNNESEMSFLYGGKSEYLDCVKNAYGFLGDTDTSRIYVLQYEYDDDVSCYCLDPVILQMVEYRVLKEEFMEFYEAFRQML